MTRRARSARASFIDYVSEPSDDMTPSSRPAREGLAQVESIRTAGRALSGKKRSRWLERAGPRSVSHFHHMATAACRRQDIAP